MPKVGWRQTDNVFGKYDGQVLAATLHQERSDGVVSVARQIESVSFVSQSIMETFGGDLLPLCHIVLVLLHDGQDLLSVQLAFELGDYDDEARVSGV